MNYKYILTAALIVAVFSGTASAWLSGYDHRMAITVNNGESSELTYYQFNFTNDTNILVAAGNMQASGADCRITDAGDNLIPFWNETPFNATGTKIWANATTLAVGDNTFYMYYGAAGASSVANITTTTLFGDDFASLVESFGSAIVGSCGAYVEERNIAIQGNYAYFGASSALKVINITNKSTPTEVGSVACGNHVIEVRVSGNYAYITNGYGSGGGGDKVRVINITDPTNPTIEGTIEDATQLDGGHGAWLDGDYFYVTTYLAGRLTVVNVSNKSTPTIESSLYDAVKFNGIHDVIIQGNYAYVTSHWGTNETYGHFVIVNISNPASPSILSSIEHVDLRGGAGGIINGNYFYMGSGPNTGTYSGKRMIIVIDISNLNSPSIINRIEGHYMYRGSPEIMTGTDKFWISTSSEGDIVRYDVSTPSAPVMEAEHHFADDSSDITVDGDYLYTSQRGAVDSFQIMDKSWTTGKWDTANNYDLVDNTAKLWGTGTAASHIISTDNVPSTFILETRTKLNASYNYYGFRWSGNDWYGTGSDIDNGVYIFPDTSTTSILKRIDGAQTTINSNAWIRSYNVWEKHKISDDGTNITFYVDDVEKCNGSDNYAGSGNKISLGSRFADNIVYYDWVFVRKYTATEPTTSLGAAETQGGGAYNITLPLGWSIIGWTDSTDRTAHYMGGLIGSNCTYVTERNRTTGLYVNHNMAGPESENNFAIERGWGYFVSTTAETLWERDT